MEKKHFLLATVFFLLYILSCNTTEPPPPPNGEQPTLELTLEDVSCIEAWIKLTTTNLELPATITLKQYNPTGDSLSQDFILNTQDSLLYIDSLLPNQTYRFHTTIQSYNHTSNELNVTTMDTTSHNFTFETFTFGGDAGSSSLYDVAIINENYILAVGEIFLTDTLGQPDPQPYGVAIWNGQSWELKKLFHNTNIPVTPRGIFVISQSEIYLASGSIFRWDGNSSTVQMVFSRLSLPDPNGTIEKLWGNSSSSIYGVGNAGSIVFFNGSSWKRIESGTLLNINDIWGDFNEKTQEWEILAVAFNYPTGFDSEIFTIKNNYVQNISTVPIMWPISTVWFISNRQYYVAGAGVYQKRLIQDGQWKNRVLDITTFTTTSIRGNSTNDVIGVGAFGDFLHFNGIGWKNDYEEPLLSNGSYTEVAVKSNLVVAVGSNQTSLNSEAIVLIGRR